MIVQLDERVFVRRLRVERLGVSELRRVGARVDTATRRSAQSRCLTAVSLLEVHADARRRPGRDRDVRRRSPSWGCRHTTSWVPIGSGTFASGVVPTSPPSTDTLAHGTALTDSEPVGQRTARFSVFPPSMRTAIAV